MQTFLPYPNFYQSLVSLDRTRLGNQVYREGKTLLNGGWQNHPIAKMWKPYRRALAQYCLSGVYAMEQLGYWDQIVIKRWFHYFEEKVAEIPDTGLPSWLGDEELHASHRSNLLRKMPQFYSKYGWQEPDNLPYKWIDEKS